MACFLGFIDLTRKTLWKKKEVFRAGGPEVGKAATMVGLYEHEENVYNLVRPATPEEPKLPRWDRKNAVIIVAPYLYTTTLPCVRK